MMLAVALLLLLHVTHSEDESISLKLCNDWEVASDLSMETYLKQFDLTSIGQYIKTTNNTNKMHDINWYLPQLLIDYFLSKFKLNGGSFIDSSDVLYSSNYGRSSYIGKKQQIITTYPEMHQLLTNCINTFAPKQCILDNLEINIENSPFNDNKQVMVYNINETHLEHLNLRMSNSSKNPGGFTMNGISEALIYDIKYPMFCWEPITDINGTFCYPNCEKPQCGENKNCINTYCPNYVVNTTDSKYKFYFDFINDNNYCIPTSNITTKKDINNNCNDNNDNNTNIIDKLFNFGTLFGFGACFILMCLIWCIARAFGVRLIKVQKTNFISDQLLRDSDRYLL